MIEVLFLVLCFSAICILIGLIPDEHMKLFQPETFPWMKEDEES